jgi:hypothetical protein
MKESRQQVLPSVQFDSDRAHQIYNQCVVLAVGAQVDLQRLSDKTLPRRIDDTTGQLPYLRCKWGTYRAFLLTCRQGAHKEDSWLDVMSTNEKLNGMWIL